MGLFTSVADMFDINDVVDVDDVDVVLCGPAEKEPAPAEGSVDDKFHRSAGEFVDVVRRVAVAA